MRCRVGSVWGTSGFTDTKTMISGAATVYIGENVHIKHGEP